MIKRIETIIVLLLIIFTCNLYAKDAVILNREGVKAGRAGDFDSALSKFSESVDIADKGTAKVFHNKAWIFEQNGDNENALKYYEKAIERNPKQVPSLEKAGYLNYLKGDYIRAVELGERVLSLDPENKEVLKWLPDAHKKRLNQKEKNIEEKEEEEEKQKTEEKIKKENEAKQKYFGLTYMASARSAYKLQTDKGFAYQSTDGLFSYNIPHMLTLSITPNENLEFYSETGTPYNGALMPEVQNWYERVEVLYRSGTVSLGVGVMGSHYKNDTFFNSNEKFNDYKMGLIIKKADTGYSLEAILYPKMIPVDTGYKPIKTLDTDYIDISVKLDFLKFMTLYFSGVVKEFYFYDHAVPVSHYVGKYDFTAGIGFWDKADSKFVFKALLTERLYMEDLDNDKPYEYLNGQGFLGLNRYKWYKGDPMSGYSSLAHVFTMKFEERPSKNFRLYQNVIVELVDTSKERHEFVFEGGAGIFF